MAMNASAMGASIASAVEAAAKREGVTATDIWTAVAQEIIGHITANAEVNTNVTTTVTTVVNIGMATGAGTGVGTGVGKIS